MEPAKSLFELLQSISGSKLFNHSPHLNVDIHITFTGSFSSFLSYVKSEQGFI